MPRIGKNNIIGLLLLSTMSGGCTVGPRYQRPPLPPTNHYTQAPISDKTVSSKSVAGNAQTFYLASTIPANWWELFHSPSINRLINKGFLHSPNIGAAKAALKVAQENYRAQVGAYLFPQFDAEFDAQRQQITGASFGSEMPAPSIYNLFNSQVNVSYNLDLFGASRNALAALCAQIDYQAYQLEATYLSLAANIVTTAITEASLQKQIQATRDIIKLEEELLEITNKQFNVGAASKNAVLTQASQLAQSKTALPPLQKSLAQTRHSLALLIGEVPSLADIPYISLDEITLPSNLPLTLPSTLVEQRPDIRASEALLKQASAQVGVATANLLPTINLTSTVGWQANQLDQLFNPNTFIWSIAGQALQPIFHGGSLLAQKRSAVAAFEQARFQYIQTVLSAFQNVADSLRAIEFDAKALAAQTESVHAAKALYELSVKQHELGAITYLALLNAQRDYNTAVISQIQAQALRYTDTAALFQSLGGTWWNQALGGK
ncbi:MAG: efflux transporter outer membrane subunit [Candidatus Berkiella sp.]